jgi:excisionase family DNA binding protein
MTAPLLNAEQAAELLNVSKWWVRQEARANRIPHIRLGRNVRFDAQALEDWWTARLRGPVPSGERMTVEEVGRRYLLHAERRGRKPSTLSNLESELRVHVCPFFADKPLHTPKLTNLSKLTKLQEAMATKTRPPRCIALSFAKSHLSATMTDVVHHHHPHWVGRHGGREQMLLMGRDDVDALLELFRFDPHVRVSDGEFVVRLPELNLIAGGATYDEAIQELIELVDEYSEEYLTRLDFYRQTDRRHHLPWLLRFVATPEEERAKLFAEPPRAAPQHVRAMA